MTQNGPGCPIRRSTDQRVLSPPRSFSQSATSFIAFTRQGIHQMPLPHLRENHPCARTQNAHGTLSYSHSKTSLQYARTPAPIRPPAKQCGINTDSQCQRTKKRLKPKGPKRPNITKQIKILKPPPLKDGGGDRDRTDDLLLAKQALSQLSYAPNNHRQPIKPGRSGPIHKPARTQKK
jgi:hypothetical protein